ANLVNASTQYNLHGIRAFAITGEGQYTNTNTFAGVGAGALTTPSSSTDSGNNNSFFGSGSGATNTTGAQNAFFGSDAGRANTTGNANAFFGKATGSANTTGGANAFFGNWAGIANTTGSTNSFFGYRAAWHNTSGSDNVIVGYDAGQFNTTGASNSFFGRGAGGSNATGNSNSYLGVWSDGTADINNSTAIGANAKVTQSNSLVLGSISGINGANADTKVGIGTTAPSFKLQVIDPSNTGLRVQTNTAGGTVASFGGFGEFLVDGVGFPGGRLNIQETGNVGIGTNGAASSKLQVIDAGNTGLRVQTNTSGGTVASFGGAGEFQIDAPNFPGGRLTVKESGDIGIGTNNPAAKLDVLGKIRFTTLGASGIQSLCRNSLNEISTCSSSLRYKTALRPFTGGLNLVNRLHPITFKWKADQSLDLGLGAEDVAVVEPLLVTHNENGEVEGVKYDRITVVLLNAVKEQQTQIEKQQAEIKQLKQLVCSSRRTARVCR
ncbi:MAG TPA: hypothetical protein VKD91_06850, partial [Pyrinomonadaceae bacterium]|nr:hypothetical protein [Pyrinomonadaceae bacterium]